MLLRSFRGTSIKTFQLRGENHNVNIYALDAHIDKPHHVFIAKAKACKQATCSKHIITITRTLTNCNGHDGPFMNLTDVIYVQSINTERIFILVINVLI
jgi:hypothetical protein